jgi:hypothetical protein
VVVDAGVPAVVVLSPWGPAVDVPTLVIVSWLIVSVAIAPAESDWKLIGSASVPAPTAGVAAVSGTAPSPWARTLSSGSFLGVLSPRALMIGPTPPDQGSAVDSGDPSGELVLLDLLCSSAEILRTASRVLGGMRYQVDAYFLNVPGAYPD